MPMKMKNMKGIDIFCASPASTAICSSTDHRSMVRNASKSKPFHHHHHYKTFSNTHNYSSATSRLAAAPCISELPFTPHLSSSSLRRKSSADVSDLHRRDKLLHSSSSRYLLGDSPFLDSLSSSSKNCLALVPSTPVVRSEERELTRSRSGAARFGSFTMDAKKEITNIRQKSMGMSNSGVVKSSSSASSSRDQVVVLRVSLHCKGCAGKLKKHLSKMEGVTSFSIDLETKKVTVIGNVSPLSVLTSISKVKYAQLWPSPTSSASTSSSSSSLNWE